MTLYEQPNSLEPFKKDVAGRRLYLMFYSASIHPTAKVLCVEISFEAFETLVISQKVKSFEVDIGPVVTIENIKV